MDWMKPIGFIGIKCIWISYRDKYTYRLYILQLIIIHNSMAILVLKRGCVNVKYIYIYLYRYYIFMFATFDHSLVIYICNSIQYIISFMIYRNILHIKHITNYMNRDLFMQNYTF